MDNCKLIEQVEGVFNAAIRRGNYYVVVEAVDDRGARSLPVQSGEILVKEKPLLTLFGIDISRAWFLVLLVIILVGSFGAGLVFERNLSKKRQTDIFIARRDISNAFAMIVKGADAILGRYSDGKLDDREAREIKSMIERIKADAVKSNKYIGESIEEIK